MIIFLIRQARKVTSWSLFETQDNANTNIKTNECAVVSRHWADENEVGYQTITNDQLPYLDFRNSSTILNTNDCNSDSPQKLELAPHFLQYKDSNTRNTPAIQTNMQVLLCTVLPTGNGRKSSRKYKGNSWNPSSLVAPPQNFAFL